MLNSQRRVIIEYLKWSVEIQLAAKDVDRTVKFQGTLSGSLQLHVHYSVLNFIQG